MSSVTFDTPMKGIEAHLQAHLLVHRRDVSGARTATTSTGHVHNGVLISFCSEAVPTVTVTSASADERDTLRLSSGSGIRKAL